MRVRGYWPLREDRAIPSPVSWVDWLDDDNDDGDDGDGDGSRGRGCRGGGNGHNQGPANDKIGSGRLLRSRRPDLGSSTSGKVFIPTNPFTDPAALQALKESLAQQPNWKASVKEDTSWEGNADENAAKWQIQSH